MEKFKKFIQEKAPRLNGILHVVLQEERPENLPKLMVALKARERLLERISNPQTKKEKTPISEQERIWSLGRLSKLRQLKTYLMAHLESQRG